MSSAKKFSEYVEQIQHTHIQNNQLKTLVIPLFFGLPGLGKTTFFHELKKIRRDTNIFVDYLSEDKIWQKLMIAQRLKTPEMSEGDVFLTIKDEGIKTYWNVLRQKMKSLSLTKSKNIILFLDKIIYPQTIDTILLRIREFRPPNVALKFVAVVPQQKKENLYHNYPFSLSLLFDCLERVIERKGHETLYGDHNLIASVVVRIFHQYKGIAFDREYLFSKGINETVEIPFIQEIDQFEELMGDKMLQEINSIFEQFQPGEIIPLKRMNKLLDQFKPLRKYFKFPKRKNLLLRGKQKFTKMYPNDVTVGFGLRRNSF